MFAFDSCFRTCQGHRFAQVAARACPGAAGYSKWPLGLGPEPQNARNGCSSLSRCLKWPLKPAPGPQWERSKLRSKLEECRLLFVYYYRHQQLLCSTLLPAWICMAVTQVYTSGTRSQAHAKIVENNCKSKCINIIHLFLYI